VPRLGLDAPIGGGRTLRAIAGEVLSIARMGLTNRARLDAAGNSEAGYLAALEDVVASGKTHAERMLAKYHGEWGGDVSRVYAEESF
jgi:glutamate--cysteine ligase